MTELIDANAVAAMLNVPVTWVREHTRSGAIPCVQLGRYVRYREGDVLAWLDTTRQRRRPQVPAIRSNDYYKAGRRRSTRPGPGNRR